MSIFCSKKIIEKKALQKNIISFTTTTKNIGEGLDCGSEKHQAAKKPRTL